MLKQNIYVVMKRNEHLEWLFIIAKPDMRLSSNTSWGRKI